MIKRVILNRRRPGMSRPDFESHWRYRHGPLLAGLPEYREYVACYVQDHNGGAAPFGRPFDYDGITEIWQRRDDALERSFAATQTYRELVVPDEMLFADRGGAIACFTHELGATGERGGTKLIALARRTPSLSSGAFEAAIGEARLQLERDTGFLGCAFDIVVPGTLVALDGSEPADRFDLMASFWIDAPLATASGAVAGFFAGTGLFGGPAIAGIFTECVFFDERPAAVTAMSAAG